MTESSQTKKQLNYASFCAWHKPKNNDDFKEYVIRGKLNRDEMASECGFGRSVFYQNDLVIDELARLEERLKHDGILPSKERENESVPLRDRDAGIRARDTQRLKSLEQQNATLKSQVKELEEKLRTLNAFDEFLIETGRLPR